MMHTLIVVSCLFMALTTQGVPLTSNKSNDTISKRSHGYQTMIVDSDVHNNVMNSRQATEVLDKRSHTRNKMIVDNMDFETMLNSRQANDTSSDSESARARRAFFINGGTSYGNTVNIRPSQTGGQAMSQRNPTSSSGFYIDGVPLVVNGAGGSRTLNPALNGGDPRPIPNSAPLPNDRPLYRRESIDDGNTAETPVEIGSRDFHIDRSNVYKNVMNSRRSVDERDTTETSVAVGSRDFLIADSNVYKNQMNSRRSVDEGYTTETPVAVGSRDFLIADSNVYKNQMNSRQNIDDDNTPKTPVVVDSRAFHISNSNVFDNQNNTRAKLDTPPLPKKANKQ